MTGTSVSRGLAVAIAARRRSRAGAMYGVWNAPATCSGMTFLPPISLTTAVALATPSSEPAMTTALAHGASGGHTGANAQAATP